MTCVIKTAVLSLGGGRRLCVIKCLIGDRHVGTQFLNNIRNPV